MPDPDLNETPLRKHKSRRNPPDATRAELARTNARVKQLEAQVADLAAVAHRLANQFQVKMAEDFNRIEEVVRAMVKGILESPDDMAAAGDKAVQAIELERNDANHPERLVE